MPGKHITDQQVRRYMQSRKDGYGQATAAARAGFSESTARRVEKHPVLPSQRDRVRRYRTRSDPFADVWQQELVPILQKMPSLRATTLLEELQRLHPGRYPDRLLRSLQRRVAHWRATEGPERELIFRQEHPPGRQALVGFHRWRRSRRHASPASRSASALPFLARLQRLAIRQGDLRRRELHRADRRVCRRRSGSSAACPASIAPTGCRRPTAISRPRRRGRRLRRVLPHYRHGADPQQCRRRARERLGRGLARPSEADLEEALDAARLARFRRSRRLPGLPRRDDRRARMRSAVRRSPSSWRRWCRCRAIARPTSPCNRQRHPLGHDLCARRALHRSLAPGRLPAQGACLRRPAGLLSRHDAGADRRAALSPAQRAAAARRRLSPPDRRAGQEAAGVPALGVPRRAVPAPGLPPRLGGARPSSSIRARPAGSMSACCILPRCMPARLSLPTISKPCSTRGRLPDLETARAAVAPVPVQMPTVTVTAPDPAVYDGLLREPAIAATLP